MKKYIHEEVTPPYLWSFLSTFHSSSIHVSEFDHVPIANFCLSIQTDIIDVGSVQGSIIDVVPIHQSLRVLLSINLCMISGDHI